MFDLEVFFPCNFLQSLEKTFLACFPHSDLQGHLAKWLEGSAKEVVADENNGSSQHKAIFVFRILAGQHTLLQIFDEVGKAIVIRKTGNRAIYFVENDAVRLVLLTKDVVLVVRLLDHLEEALAGANVTCICHMRHIAALFGELPCHRTFASAGWPMQHNIALVL